MQSTLAETSPTSRSSFSDNSHDEAVRSPQPPLAASACLEEQKQQQQQLLITTHLVIANISKRPNVRALISTAIAMGVSTILIVGQPSLILEEEDNAEVAAEENDTKHSLQPYLRNCVVPARCQYHQYQYYNNSHSNADINYNNVDLLRETIQHPPPRGKVFFIRFEKWADCVSCLRQCEIPLVGVEIDARAITIQQLLDKITARSAPTTMQQSQWKDDDDRSNITIKSATTPTNITSMALVMGNEGQGLSTTQMKDCQHLVRLPQYGAGTASYNVYVAASLVLQRLHQYNTTQQYQQQQYQQQQKQQVAIQSS